MTKEIQITRLKKKYRGGAEALKGVDLEIGQGRIFALLGPNGAGKTTLIRIMTTLTKKDSGEIRIAGLDPEKEFAGIRTLIGVASQDNELDPSESAAAQLFFQCRLFGMPKKEAGRRTDELIGLFDLEGERDKKAAALSGGNKRRLHCALALVHHPRILFLDEPTVGMDPLARSTFWRAITDMNANQGVTVLLTTQYLEEADKYASDMALLIEGRVRYAGEVSAFKNMMRPDERVSLEDSYLAYVKSMSLPETEPKGE